MQTRHADASSFVRSLDNIFFIPYKWRHYEAVLPHKARTKYELDLQVGDHLQVVMRNGNRSNAGYFDGLNLRTRLRGRYPSLKVKSFVDVVDMPTYPQAEDYHAQ